MILQFPRKLRAEPSTLEQGNRDADLHAMGVMLSYLMAEAERLDLQGLADTIRAARAKLPEA
ncbi:hypothetical protein [Antarcticirhabdus aurantiaca]|uniref:Uncharacterized protein n=1 Tax=Antarcticirhabdus aurantiaca TaxID=2606717 RepID=A0ACD4NIY4_9HYPH|nr:hypothetical protein [Antarcticirhabdus aurantiaca]WAJ26814.1 hypothetical protein OXU80_18355 [Jeongeuplla avenae]